MREVVHKAHHQELETILVLLAHMMCNAWVDEGRLLEVQQQGSCAQFPSPRTHSLLLYS
jgi:hypothetical protein